MSGGAFNYEDSKLNWLAEQLFDEICSEIRIQHDTEFGYCKKSDEFINKLKLMYGTLMAMYNLMHRADWVLSGDDDETDFEPRLKKDLEELKAENAVDVQISFKDKEVKFKFKQLPEFVAKPEEEDDY